MGEARRVRDRYNAAFNAHDIDALLSTVSPDAAILSPEGLAEGREELGSYLEEFWAAFPDVHTVVLESFDTDDTTIDEVVFVGTHKGPYRGPGGKVIPPTGRPVNIRACYVCTVENGLIVSMRVYLDQMELLSQLGVPPE
ncbi:ester cyclase [Microbispora sp. CSR-4]|uniref:ester cyclase n=1 Tax=Microbispora sp. CSR-4 TaxID=2592813 RepID=UPI00164F4589|nr:ester cyclase [Microbispora sp. CSR-4]